MSQEHNSPQAGAASALEKVRLALGEAQGHFEALSAKNHDLKRNCDGANARCGELETERDTLQVELDESRVTSDHLRQKLAEMERKFEDSQTENARLNGQISQLVTQMEHTQRHNEALREEIIQLHTELFSGDLPSLVLQIATKLTGAEVGLFTEADGDDTLASIGMDEIPDFLNEALYRYSRQVAHDGQPLVENNSQALPDGSQMVNLAALPLAMKGAARGVILLANKRGGPFTEEDTRLLLAIGQHAGIALENARLHAELTRAYAGTVAVLADAIEAKDAYTRGHCEDVSRVAVEVAKRLGVDDAQLEQVRYAALLHDVGKIGIPDGILLKPSKLLPEEFSIIQRHTQIGYDLVTRVPTLKPLGEMILHHHERWDGGGYPDQLAGETIPLVSRVIGAVDALDAMTTPRPYRDAMPVVEAINELERCAGSQFDPHVVETLVQVVGEMNIFALEAFAAPESETQNEPHFSSAAAKT